MAIEPDRRRVLALNDRGLPHLILYFHSVPNLVIQKYRQITSSITVAVKTKLTF